jgi:hypothetical protein
MKQLPQTGTAALLEVLSPHLDDGFINDLFSQSASARPARQL